MNRDLISCLDLPVGSRVDLRVPKKLLLENGAPAATDKRYINDGIEEIFWVAALKPTTIGVPEYRDAVREYLEIAVLRLTLRSGAKMSRLVELVHRAVPYPVLLLCEQVGQVNLSVAHKRWSQNEAGKTVLDGEVVAAECDSGHDSDCWEAFCTALALDRQPRTTIYSLYQGWIDTVLGVRAAGVTGEYRLADNPEHSAIRLAALRECELLGVEIARLRAAAAKEKQMARRVELNMELKRAETQWAMAKDKL